ncbi:MFS transporter [Leptolyngbya sp. FACHB-671]|uniref:MFS transporter n=1 Tax=Leptolyngbya sp. FACHB-671 TaxID=2692812 RepID=UPI001689B134|nr:MFS transporter [Leptolyngbya sp. FACHB-671]MBD2070454.1 MFS transporter [Leptolyngbya sp. FACHB-671]
MNSFRQKLLAWLPQLDHRVWILIAGRLLSQIGNGFTLFYAPIFFVNQVGLSATIVGIGIGSGSISGVLGRILGGSFADSPSWGRRKTLLLSAAVSALADIFLTLTYDFPTFLIGNLLMGLGIGLYWPATEAVVADLTSVDQRNEAFALTRLGDTVGLGLGVVLGGALIALTGAYRSLFVIDGISFLVFFGVVYWAIAETVDTEQVNRSLFKGWAVALRDRTLLIFALVNILFTTYLAQINSAMPLYFTNFVPVRSDASGFSTSTISTLFSWHIILAALTQLPIARYLNRFSRVQALTCSALLWGIGFLLIGITGTASTAHLIWAILGLSVMAIATAAYNPSASALVVDLAPESLRGVYLSINSLCWAVGYFIGPTVGGWAMDQTRSIAQAFWMVSALSVLLGIAILLYLGKVIRHLDDG